MRYNINLNSKISFLFVAAVLFVFPLNLMGQEKSAESPKAPEISWIAGPEKAEIGSIAEIKIPKGYNFADGDDTRKIMKYFGNPETNLEQGYLAPESDEWFIVFEFSDTGYVKDDEKDNLDADEIFKSMQEGNRQGNEWRKENGLPELKLVGWYKKPYYNEKTNNIEWATIAESANGKSINYNIRYLGRKGVMEAIVVADPKDFDAALKESKKLLKTYEYKKGNKYSEWVKGDKIAEYGLTALVTGGAAAAAVKSGLLQKFWKFIVAGLVGIGAFFKKAYSSFMGRGEKSKVELASEVNSLQEKKEDDEA